MKIINRIKRHEEFNKVIDEGKLLKSDSISLYYLKNDRGYTRIGISVPKKSGNAVVRNKIKRQIRAIIACSTDYKKSCDIVMIARKRFDIDKFENSKSDIVNLLEKVG